MNSFIDKEKCEQSILSQRFLAAAKNEPDFSIIEQLCTLSFCSNTLAANKATKAIFSIIESLCDDFSDFGVSLTSEILAHILQHIRSTSQGSELDTMLNNFGFTSQEALVNRYKNLLQKQPISEFDKTKVKKILILSRVTAGADIAITGIIIKRLAKAFPATSLVLIGPSHLIEMFGDIPNTCCFTYIYKNDGSLFEKMTSWPKLLTIAQKETLGFKPGEVLLFDPDSRLSQLGLLPLIDDQHTYIFPSRACQPYKFNNKNLSYLANQWLNSILNENKTVYPKISFVSKKTSRYTKFYNAIKANGCEFVITINFGVGNDPSKKIKGHFEEALLHRLLETPNTVVVLDTGRGKNESTRVQHLLRLFKDNKTDTAQVTGEAISSFPVTIKHGLIAFKGPLGALGKMIDATDCFIGYDSCGQHLANATRTPAVILFAGAPTTRFIHRWAPTNKENVTIPVNNNSLHDENNLDSLLDLVETAVMNVKFDSPT